MHSELLSTETRGLEEAAAPEHVRLSDGETYAIEIRPVRKRIGDAEVRMLGYNGSIPGPILRVDQHSEVTIEATNLGDVEATLHWHGLRLANPFDGVPNETQAPIPRGGSFTYRVQFPDPGFYWYHPHIREDYAQEMGLYGAIIVEPSAPDYWPPADRELALTLDDVLIEDGKLAPFLRSGPTYTAMGRLGNVMLVNGETDYRAEAAAGEVVRFHLVNTANTRFFNFMVGDHRMKLVGGDSGRVEREQLLDAVQLSPSERVTVDVLFERAGEAVLEHRLADESYELGRIAISGEVESAAAAVFEQLRVDPELAAMRDRLRADLEREPDKVLALRSEMPDDPDATMEDMIWKLVDRATGAANHDIKWSFRVGDRVKIRVTNELDQHHAMPHPFHIHGAGRFLTLARDGKPEPNLCWKDTVLVGAGETVDILLDVTNPGVWMAHCHIAEHIESGMMFSFEVAADAS